MFEEIRKCLDEFENTLNECSNKCNVNQEDKDILCYLELNLAKALLQDDSVDSAKVAKIILAAKGLGNGVVVKVE